MWAKPLPPKFWGFEELDIYLNDNFEPTTPFFSGKWERGKDFGKWVTCGKY
jgi:hypothetical protein